MSTSHTASAHSQVSDSLQGYCGPKVSASDLGHTDYEYGTPDLEPRLRIRALELQETSFVDICDILQTLEEVSDF